MSSEWETQTFGDLVDFVSLKARADEVHPATYVSTENMLPDLGGIQTAASVPLSGSVSKFSIDDILFSNIRTYFKKVWKAEFNGQCSNDVLVFRPKDFRVLLPGYLHNLCRWNKFTEFSVRTSKGAKMPRGDKEALAQFQYELPPIEVQRAIIGILSSFDDRITLLRETNTTLEAIAQALYKSWFVDFDPVHAKMQGITPEGMDEATAALFPDSFEESELGEVPKEWKLVPFGQLLSHTIGGDWGSDVADEKDDTRVAIIRGTDIPDLQTNANSRVPVRYTSKKKLAGRKLEDGDLLLEVSGGSKDQPTGRSLYLSGALLSQFDCPVEPASFCRLLRPADKEVGMLLAQHLTYIYAQGKTWEYQNQSTGIANFQTTHFLETELVACPPDDVLKAFAETVQPLIARTHLTQIQELASLRDTLLPRLISGQLSLADAATETI